MSEINAPLLSRRTVPDILVLSEPLTTGFNATHQVLCVQLKSRYKYTDSFLSDPRDVFTALVSPAAGVKHLDEESLSKAAEFLC